MILNIMIIMIIISMYIVQFLEQAWGWRSNYDLCSLAPPHLRHNNSGLLSNLCQQIYKVLGYTTVFFSYPPGSANLDVDIYFKIPKDLQQWWLKYIFQVALLIWLNRIIYRKLSEVRVVTNKVGITNDSGIGREMGREICILHVIYIYILYVYYTDL